MTLAEQPERPLNFVVAGAIVLDCLADIPYFPTKVRNVVRTGEKRRATGGNAPNQAEMLNRLGHRASLAARIGKDGVGDDLIADLEARGVGTAFVERKSGMDTPICEVFLTPDGRNFVIWGISPQQLPSAATIKRASAGIKRADAVLATFELPAAALTELINRAQAHEKPVFLNAGPVRSADEIAGVPLDKVHTLTCNQLEAQSMLDLDDAEIEDKFKELPWLLAEKYGVGRVCVTRGQYGVLYWDGQRTREFPAFEASPIDPTAAGDAFAATYAALIMEGYEPNEAISHALVSSALTIERPGAMDSIPSREEIIDYLRDPSEITSERVLTERRKPGTHQRPVGRRRGIPGK